MKRLAAGSFWLEMLVWGFMTVSGVAQAEPPADVVIATSLEAQAFHGETPFVFEGQALAVHTSFATDRRIELQRLAPVIVGAGTHFVLNGVVDSSAAPMSAPLEKRGAGTLAMTGANRYASNTILREGRLRLGGDSSLGMGLYTLEQHAGTALHLEPGTRLTNFIQAVDARPGDFSLPGIEGVAEWRVDSGSATLLNTVNAQVPLRKTGDGVLRLAGAVHGHPLLDVQAGALAVDGMAAARVTVGPGARLEGHGELMQARIRTGGTLAPGGRNAVGRLGIWGDVVFDADSLYHVNALPDGQSDLLQVGGAAGLDGRVWVDAGSGQWSPDYRYLILAADGGLGDSRFAGVAADLAFLDPALEYDANHVYLTLHRNDLGAGDVGETPEEEEVGDAIDPPGGASRPLTPLQKALRNMTVKQVRTVLRQASGSWHASVRSFLVDDGRHVRQAVLESAAGEDAIRGAGARGLHSWAQAYAASGRRGAVDAVDGDHHHSQGVVMGLDAAAGRYWRPGVVLAAQQARLAGAQGMTSADTDSLHAGFSAQGRRGGLRMTVALLRAWHRIDSRRQVSAGSLQEGLRSTYAGRSWHGVMELASQLHRLAPYLRHEWARLRLPAHVEDGGLSAHGVDASSTGLHATTLGWRARHGWLWQGRQAWLEADLGWRHVWGAATVASTQHFAGEAQAGRPARFFSSAGQPLTRHALALAVSAEAAPWRAARLSLRYAGLYGAGRLEHAGWVGFRWSF